MWVTNFKDFKVTKTEIKKLISGSKQQMGGANCGGLCKGFKGVELNISANKEKDFGKYHYYYSASIEKREIDCDCNGFWTTLWEADFKEFKFGDETELANAVNKAIAENKEKIDD